ncbi:hypothetical protein N7478_005821 [Penicillium angulare]|uniref:uncharacterized protein n=1 Tax=Penicillium angulare TaxID=116970 RepID=UPI00254094DD|nr:uncharacterized protein N7478_005821 [Penicillium angulare]KAJ5280449.1 hypothetical protein N7478_005821 [Penicillium angulare]
MPNRKRAAGSPAAKKPDTVRKKPERERRQLVRWDPDLDILLLLTVQQSCNATGVKIPWQLVAQTMGPKFTEGAIIQHLSKLRLRRDSDEKPNPPPLRRSVPAAGSGIRNIAKKKAAAKKEAINAGEFPNEMAVEEDEEGTFSSSEDDDPSWSQSGNQKRNSAKRVKAHKKSKGFKASTPEDDAQVTGDLRCVGASFLRLEGDNDTEIVTDSDDETDEELEDGRVSIKQKHRILSLPISPEALHRLENSGSVAHTRSTEMTPDLTPSDNNSQPIFSSPPPNWGTPQHQVPLSPYQPNFRVGPSPYAGGYADPSYSPIFVPPPPSHPYFVPQPGYPGRQPAVPTRPPVMPHPAMQNSLDPSLYNEASSHGWIQAPAPTFGQHNTLGGAHVNNNLPWDGTMETIQTSSWRLQEQDLEGSPEFEAKEEI